MIGLISGKSSDTQELLNEWEVEQVDINLNSSSDAKSPSQRNRSQERDHSMCLQSSKSNHIEEIRKRRVACISLLLTK